MSRKNISIYLQSLYVYTHTHTDTDTHTHTHTLITCFVQQLSKFLQAMQQQHNLVRVKELTKGVESIVEVDWKNQAWVSQALPQLKEIFGWVSNVWFPNIQPDLCFFFFITLTRHRLRSFSAPEGIDDEAAPMQDGGEGEAPYYPPEITTLYSVSARLGPLFLEANKRCVCVCVCVCPFMLS